MDLPSLTTELHLRGLDEARVDSALRCLVHVYSVQDFASPETGGVLAEDIINTYDLAVVQAATQLFLDTSVLQGREVFRVRWGCQDAAERMASQLWEHASDRWNEFAQQVNERYLGFILPSADDGARVVANWKLAKDLKWFSVAVPRHGWYVLRMVEDLSEVALRLDLGFEFRPYGSEGVQGKRVLLHQRAYDILKEKGVPPPEELKKLIRLWKFFSEYDVHGTDIVALMKECNLTLDDIVGQISVFFEMNLTSQYRDGQYPPYFINEKKQKEFQLAVRGLLRPMDEWLTSRVMLASEPVLEPQTEVEKAAAVTS